MGTIKTESIFKGDTATYPQDCLQSKKRVKMGLTINGEHGRANDLLKTGDVVCVNLPDIEKDIEAVPLPLSIVYEDDDIIVINKD